MSCSGRTTINGIPNISEDIITFDELKFVIKKLENNKSPGPDSILVEFFMKNASISS